MLGVQLNPRKDIPPSGKKIGGNYSFAKKVIWSPGLLDHLTCSELIITTLLNKPFYFIQFLPQNLPTCLMVSHLKYSKS